MTLSEERELEIIGQDLTYGKADAHINEPHWYTKYPWIAAKKLIKETISDWKGPVW